MGVTGATHRRHRFTTVVTNEGNDETHQLPPTLHVADDGVEKVLPTLDDVATLMRLLPSTTGQLDLHDFSVLTGPRRARGVTALTHVHRAGGCGAPRRGSAASAAGRA